MLKINIKDEMGRLYTDDYGQVHLDLKGKHRMIGRIFQDETNKVYKKVETLKGVFRKNNSWSLCNAILNELADNDVINIFVREEGKTYWLTAKEARELGDFLWFKTSGIERKLYIPLEKWHQV